MTTAFWLVMRREFALAFRRWSDLALPWLFFIIVCMLFPLAIGQDPAHDRGRVVLPHVPPGDHRKLVGAKVLFAVHAGLFWRR